MPTQAPAPPPSAAPTTSKCPNCGNDVDRDQPFCLECGRRLHHDYRKPPSFRIPIALVALVLIAVGAGAGFAVTQLTQEDDKQPDAITVNEVDDPGQAQQQNNQNQTQQGNATPSTPANPAKPAEWPEGKRAYTVVLLATADAKIANSTAAKATADGATKGAGVLKGKNFNGLDTKQYFVFAGQYDDQDAATTKAKELAGTYPGASARLIEPKPK